MKRVGPTKYGPRQHGGASLTLAAPLGLPKAMRGPIVEVKGLRTDEDRRGLGDATILMLQTTTDADMGRYMLFLRVDPDADTDKQRLTEFYARNGFVPVQVDPLLMARMPVGAQHGRV